jgi:hypothetical protein
MDAMEKSAYRFSLSTFSEEVTLKTKEIMSQVNAVAFQLTV